jgi:hypothetical protein
MKFRMSIRRRTKFRFACRYGEEEQQTNDLCAWPLLLAFFMNHNRNLCFCWRRRRSFDCVRRAPYNLPSSRMRLVCACTMHGTNTGVRSTISINATGSTRNSTVDCGLGGVASFF